MWNDKNPCPHFTPDSSYHPAQAVNSSDLAIQSAQIITHTAIPNELWPSCCGTHEHTAFLSYTLAPMVVKKNSVYTYARKQTFKPARSAFLLHPAVYWSTFHQGSKFHLSWHNNTFYPVIILKLFTCYHVQHVTVGEFHPVTGHEGP